MLAARDSWVFGPDAPYERDGDVKDVVFPCGQTIDADGDTIHLYYGAADTCIAMATGSIKALLSWLDANSCPDEIICRLVLAASMTDDDSPVASRRRLWVTRG